jgi:hypothetical protein
MSFTSAAEYVDVSVKSIRRLVDDGKLEVRELPITGERRTEKRVRRRQLDELLSAGEFGPAEAVESEFREDAVDEA